MGNYFHIISLWVMASLAAAYPENPIARSPSDALRQLTRRQSECLVGYGQCKEGAASWCCGLSEGCYVDAEGHGCCCPDRINGCDGLCPPEFNSIIVIPTPTPTPGPSSAIVTPAPSSEVVATFYSTYYWTITWSYTWYYYIDTYVTWSWYFDYTTISYSATDAAEATAWFNSYSATVALPTSAEATSLVSLYTPSATGAPTGTGVPTGTGGVTTATGTGSYIPPTLPPSVTPFTGVSNLVGPNSGLLMAVLAAAAVVPGVLAVLL